MVGFFGVICLRQRADSETSRGGYPRFLPWTLETQRGENVHNQSPHVLFVRHGEVLRLICGFVVQFDWARWARYFTRLLLRCNDADSPVANHNMSRQEV
jgi:hypothetical protein